MKKRLSLLLAGIGAASLASCGLSVEEVNNADGVLNILCMEAGYGTQFMDAWIEEFKKDPKNKDIPINVVYDVQVTETIEKYFNDSSLNPYDLIFSGAINYKDKADKNLLESITDVYEAFENPIVRDFADYGKYKDEYYVLPWVYGPTGLIYNTDMLPEDRVPLTSDELIRLCDDILNNRIPSAAGKKPFVWGGKNASPYWEYVADVWWAQYEGVDVYRNFWSLNDSAPDGYSVYGQEGIKKAYSVLSEIVVPKNCVYSSDTKDHTGAQTNFMLGDAVMIPCGDWIESEMRENYSEVTSYKMMKTPVLSALGASLKLAGESAADAQHDAKLSEIVKGIDGGKTDAEISSATGTAENKIREVRDARQIVVSISNTHQAFIPASSNAKTEAKAFLKFMSGNAAAEIFKREAHSALPFEYSSEIAYTGSAYLENNYAITRDAAFIYFNLDASSIRYKGGVKKWMKHDPPVIEFYAGTLTAQKFFDDNYHYFTPAGDNKWNQHYNRR